MNKKNIFFYIILIILIIALVIITYLYYNSKKDAKNNLNQLLIATEEKTELIHKVNELQDELNKQNVTIMVEEDSITSKGAIISITDKNDNPFHWYEEYKIQARENEEWKDIEPISNNISFSEIEYQLDENGHFNQIIDWTQYYGDLPTGTYRIVKNQFNYSDVIMYSNEFEIK